MKKGYVLTDIEKELKELQGLVINRAMARFHSLPSHVQSRIELEEWIASGVHFVLACLFRRAAFKYQKSRASFRTYAYRALDNFYKTEQWKESVQRMHGSTASLDALMETVGFNVSDQQSEDAVFVFDSVRRVQELHRNASSELQEYLDLHFFSQEFQGRVVVRGKRFNALRDEFRDLAKRHCVSLTDYKIAIGVHFLQQTQWRRQRPVGDPHAKPASRLGL